MKTMIALSLLLLSAPALADESGPGDFCPADGDRKTHRDHCAHEGQYFRDRDGSLCPGRRRSPIDGIHTSEARMAMLTECFGKPPEREEYLLCVGKHVEAYYRVCPHYKGLF